MANINNISEAINTLKNLVEALPMAVQVDTTLTKTGQAADAKATGDALAGKAAISHTQAASTISAGTFAGAVVAQTSSQIPATSLLRNSKIVNTENNPENNGEIVWRYS